MTEKENASYAGRAARCGPASNHHTAPDVAQARMDGLEHFAVEKAKCEPVWENALDAHLAEAAVESGQHLDRALWAVNEIRDRAGMPDIENIDIEKVRQERRVELAFENLRFWDLKRWRIAHKDAAEGGLNGFRGKGLHPYFDVRSEKYQYVVADDIPKRRRIFTEKNYYTKFSSSDMNANPSLIQNPEFIN